MAGVRIAGELSFTPAYINLKGALVNDRCEIPVIGNNRRGTGPDGKPGRRSDYRLIGWSGVARAMAKYGAPGKALDVNSRPESYPGREWRLAPNPAAPGEMSPQPIMIGGEALIVKKMGFTITEFNFGEDSPKQIQRELQLWASNPGNIGGRPPQWNVVGSADAAQYSQIIDQRKQAVWDGQAPYFGFARIVMPAKAQRLLTVQERTILETQGARALNLPAPQQAQPAGTTGAVAATFQAQPVTQVQPAAQLVQPVQPVMQAGAFATGAPNPPVIPQTITAF